jgi:hypothetical protein
MVKQKIEIRPQEGFQKKFMSTAADICIGGGAAGVGKTFVELMEPLRHIRNKNFGAVIFRRTYPQITMQGGLWDESKNLYPFCGAIPNESELQWNFLSGAKITFRHMLNESVLDQYQGAQIPLIEYDELTHFTKRMFMYLLSRNRSTSGVRPYVRATCNPDPDSWVAEYISWWIDQETGFPIPERAGKLRYMVADQDQFVWGDTKNEVFEKARHVFQSDAVLRTGLTPEQIIKSVTFIPGSIYENKELLKKDPAYIGNLMAQDEAMQARLLHGNWKIRSDKKNLFEFFRLDDMFHNIVVNDDPEKYIVIDHAREGRDFCVIGTWEGWKCIRIDILPKSNTNDILRVVQMLRTTFGGIPTSNIIIDQDGIGVKDFLECHTFFGASKENEVSNNLPSFHRVGDKFQKRGYKNKRAQLYYYLAEKVNQAQIFINLDNVYFHYDAIRIERVNKVKLPGNKEVLIKDLIKEELRTVRKPDIEREGVKEIISKEQHKIAIGGRSPDHSDMLMMRGQLDFIPRKKYMKS